MKPIFNSLRFTLALTALLTLGLAAASATEGLFSVVPAGDDTYTKLGQLEMGGLLSPGSSRGTLTRYEVAQLITKAQNQLHGIVVAQVDEIPPPPDSDAGATPPPGASTSTSLNSTPPPPPIRAPPPPRLQAPLPQTTRFRLRSCLPTQPRQHPRLPP